ncbi:MAG: PAS domain S-box protein [Aulosira sp. ZfuVER01]|nr:PAS domain S-box protein [Aulosira sp. ZfuVER01]MDZ7996444.1 PAS domain S-box protein [Aulosira sp. DedVER01a]MDZ8050348.1 PAS domain S-box protein [Aulosira sp. ZfuCHP01]
MQSLYPVDLPTLEQVIECSPLNVLPDTLLMDAIALMNSVSKHKVKHASDSCVLVVKEKKIVGILTLRDIVRLTGTKVDLSRLKISEVMTQPVISLTFTPEQNPLTALSFMHQHRIRHLPLVDEQEQLLGLITQDRICQAIQTLQTNVAKQTLQLRQYNQQLEQEVIQCHEAEKSLRQTQQELELRVAERTAQLVLANTRLQQEIEERKQAEIQIRKFVSLADNSSEFIGMCDMDFVPFYVNEAGRQMIGLDDLQHYKNTPVREFFFPEDQDFIINEFFSRVLDEGRAEVEIRFRHFKTGEALWMVYSVCCIKDSNNQLIGLATLSRNITDRKQAQQKIQEQAALIDIATDAIFVRDLENRILFWSRGAENLYGCIAEESVGKLAHTLFHQESSSQLEAALKTTLEQGYWQGEVEQLTKTGREIIVASRWTPIKNQFGHSQSILVVNTDITEKKQLEQQFYRAQRLESIGTLASGIAHDLNNVFAPIMMIAQLLPLKCQNVDARTQELFQTLVTSSQRGANLVKQILTFARGKEGKRILVQPGHLLKELVNVINQTFPKSIEVLSDISTNTLWMVKADPTQLEQIFMNLAVNARDAMPNGGIIKITAENRIIEETYAQMHLEAKAGRHIVVSISDTGTGIPPELLDRIFDPFFTTKEVGKGTGLGLSTVLGIVKNHGGFVEVSSQLSEGTTFQVFLPIAEGIATETITKELLPLGNGELVLVVDDEVVIQQTTQESLADYNYKTIVANDGVEALAVYAQHQPEISVVLLDISMPNMDGLTAMRSLLILNPQVKIIAVSGLPSNEQKAMAVGAYKFLSKPYTATDLLNILADAIQIKQ